MKTFGRDAVFFSFSKEFPMIFDDRNEFSSSWPLFRFKRFIAKLIFWCVAAETLKCGHVAPARVWATVAKPQVLRHAGFQEPAFQKTHVLPMEK